MKQLGRSYEKCVIKSSKSSKLTHENRISEALKAYTKNIKSWWKLSKQALIIDRTTESVPHLIHNNKLIENVQDKADILNNYFVAKLQLKDVNAVLPDIIETPYKQLHTTDITYSDVQDI